MNEQKLTKISKRLSLVLRHQPQRIKIELDEQGWVAVDTLLAAFNAHFFKLSLAELEEVVEQNNKKRFAWSEDRSRIRASQGHSVAVNLGYKPQEPPPILFHGTATRFLDSIRAQGLLKQKRHHVHLSADTVTAHKVAIRHGKPVILQVKALSLYQSGTAFFISENGVWLTEQVPSPFINFPEEPIGSSSVLGS